MDGSNAIGERTPGTPATEQSLSELVQQLSDQTTTLARKEVEAGTPPMPERAIASSKEDVETAKQAVKEGRT